MSNGPDIAREALELFRRGDFAGARPLLEGLLAAGNTPVPCILALAETREACGDADEATTLLDALHAAMPHADFAVALASALQRAGDCEGLERHLPVLRKAHPDDGRLAAIEAEHRLKRGDYATGFDLLPHRWAISAGAAMTAGLACPEWDGRRFDGTLLVGTEQGLGETILWSSMFRDIARLGQKTLVACDARLLPLFRRSFPALDFADAALHPLLAPGRDPANRRIESGDLGRLFRRSAGDFPTNSTLPANSASWPANGAWLIPDRERVARLRAEYQERFPGKRLVGLSWCSHRRLRHDTKNVPLADLEPLLSDPALQCVSLQYGDITHDLRELEKKGLPLYRDPHVDITRDIDASAALAAAMDRVVSGSNTMAHLAGALGLPTELRLTGNRYVLWYWGYAGDGTPWYPSMRICRGPIGYTR